VWASTDTYLVGDDLVRIRASSIEAAAAIRIVLGHRLVDDVDGDFLYSVRLEPPVRGEQPLHVLYEMCNLVRRSRDPMRILRMLLAHVEGRERIGRRGPLQVAGIAVVGDRGAAALPLSYETSVGFRERRLAAAGLRLVDTPFLEFDAVTAELLVPGPAAIDATVLDGIDLYRGTDPGPAPPGRHALRGWLLEARRGAADLSRIGLDLALNREATTDDRARRVITKIQDRAALLSPWHPEPDDLVRAIVRLAEGRR
jgi:hypothetical protein